MMRREVTIDARFKGPPASGNGGYSCGVLAEAIDGVATVRLRVPPPLDTPMTLEGDGASGRLSHGDLLIGEAEGDALDLSIPEPPTLEQGREAVPRYRGFEGHPFPECFVCGPDRRPGDGLRLFAGQVAGRELVASPWVPDETLAQGSGTVDQRSVWAALDCPSYFAIETAPLALLASLTADIARVPAVGEQLIAYGWHRHSEGRKHYCGSGLATPEAEIVASAAALWIEPRAGAASH
jgi:hypothetical protein